MTKEEIMELSEKCGIKVDDSCSAVIRSFVFNFALAVAEKELDKAAERAWIALVGKGADWSIRQTCSDAILKKEKE